MSKQPLWPLLIFDLDGTLLDSAEDLWVSINKMLLQHKKSTVDLQTLTHHIGDGLRKLVHDFFPEYIFDSQDHIDRVEEFLDIYRQNMTTHSRLYPDVMTFLKTYPGPKALVTNKSIQPTLFLFKHYQLDQINWVDIIGGDSLSDRKPSPVPLQHVMSKAGYTPENTWMIGDGRPDMQAAQAAGCKKVAALYGYSPMDVLRQFNPDFSIQSLQHLKTLLTQNFAEF